MKAAGMASGWLEGPHSPSRAPRAPQQSSFSPDQLRARETPTPSPGLRFLREGAGQGPAIPLGLMLWTQP